MKIKAIILWSTIFYSIPQAGSSSDRLSDISDSSIGSVSTNKTVESYIYNDVNPEWAKEDLKDLKDWENSDSLQIFAFNTGQANCIVLTKNSKSVMIDGGYSGELQNKEKLVNLLAKNPLQKIFITHPHDDHYNLFITYKSDANVTNALGIDFSSYSFFLGGDTTDWMDSRKSFLLGDITENIEYYESSMDSEKTAPFLRKENLLQNVYFDILNIGRSRRQSVNSKSLIIKVTDINNNIALLFTGDAEGESVNRAYGVVQRLDPLVHLLKSSYSFPSTIEQSPRKKIKTNTKSTVSNPVNQLEICCANINKLFHEMEETDKLQNEDTFNYTANEFQKNYEEIANLCPKIELMQISSNDLFSSFIRFHILRKELLNPNVRLLFLPHHGTNTEHSQRWLSFLKNNDKIFVISSTPSGQQGLPKASTFAMIPNEPKQLEHPFLYTPDNDKSDIHLKMTTKPVFLTGAEPGGVCIFKIDNKAIYKIDTLRRDLNEESSSIRWIEVIPKPKSSSWFWW